MTKKSYFLLCFKALAVILSAQEATYSIAQSNSIVMASTTSTEQSGLFAALLPEFKKSYRY